MLPSCETMVDCQKFEGKRISVIGIYTVWDPLPKRARDHPPARQVMLIFADGEPGIYLGAWGYPGHFRSLDEIDNFAGKQVCVTGKFLRKMPPHPKASEDAESLSGPCIFPVEEIKLV